MRHLFFLLLPIFFPFAYGTLDDFATDKSLYHEGDTMTISGTFSHDPKIPFVTIQVLTPGKSTFSYFWTFSADSEGSFLHSLTAGGPTWTPDGTYTVRVTYGETQEKPIEYRKSPPEPDPEKPKPKPELKPEPDPKPNPKPEAKPETKPELKQESKPEPVTEPSFTTLKLIIPNFPSLDKSPQHYIDRYNTDPTYKSWFDSQFPSASIGDVVGYKPSIVPNFPSLDKSPQHYIDRYNTDPTYKSWFDSQFPDSSLYNVLGYADPVPIPAWIKANAKLWAAGDISTSDFAAGIEFMLENDIIMVSGITSDVLPEHIPSWVRNSANWWSQDLISEDEFATLLQFLIQEAIIKTD